MSEQLKEESKGAFSDLFEDRVDQEFSQTIVIPAYNEEKRIGPFLESLIITLPETTEIIVVFDGSDDTPKIVKSFGERVKLMKFRNRLGKGGAIIEGFKHSKGEVVGFVDADGAIPPAEVQRLAAIVTEDNPCVIGSRWVKSSKVEIPEPIPNIFAGRVFHYLTFLVLGLKVKDTQCGIKFFHRTLLQQLIKKVTIKDRMIDIALLFHVKLLRKRITEVGIHWKHVPGTKLPILRIIPIMFAILVGLKLIHSSKFKKNFLFLSQVYAEIKEN